MGRILGYDNYQRVFSDFSVIEVPDSGRNRLENVCQFHFGIKADGYCSLVANDPKIRLYGALRGSSEYYLRGNC